jgi:hypothetical protein
MSEIELVDKKSYPKKELTDKTISNEVIIKNKFSLKSLLFLIFSLIIIFCLIISIFFQSSTSTAYNQENKTPTFEKISKPKRIEESKIIPYETPFKLEGTLDYLLYPYHSDIIKDMDDYEFIRDCLGKISLKMVFNSNINGDYALDVHTRVNYHHILALVETENGNRFGGYTSDNFSPESLGLTSTSIGGLKQDKSAFLFNLDTKKYYDIKKKDVNRALDCDDYFTFCFGEGDLILRDQFLTNGGSSYFPDCFGDENTQKHELTNGEETFTVKSFEIYHVLFFSEFGDENNRMGVHKSYVK